MLIWGMGVSMGFHSHGGTPKSWGLCSGDARLSTGKVNGSIVYWRQHSHAMAKFQAKTGTWQRWVFSCDLLYFVVLVVCLVYISMWRLIGTASACLSQIFLITRKFVLKTVQTLLRIGHVNFQMSTDLGCFSTLSGWMLRRSTGASTTTHGDPTDLPWARESQAGEKVMVGFPWFPIPIVGSLVKIMPTYANYSN